MTRSAFSLALAAVLLQAPASWAAQLDKESCTKLKSEQVQLEKEGTRSSLGKGPDWAKANLAPEKIEQVRRLIEVDEQLLFRCGGRPLVVLPNDPDAAPGEGAADKPEKAPLEKDKSPADGGKRAPAPLPKAIAPAPKATPGPKAMGPEPKATAPKATAVPPREPAKEVRPPAPLPRGNAPAAASALAKEAQPAGPASPAAPPPVPPSTKEDPSQATPAATLAAPPASPAPDAADEKKAAALKAPAPLAKESTTRTGANGAMRTHARQRKSIDDPDIHCCARNGRHGALGASRISPCWLKRMS